MSYTPESSESCRSQIQDCENLLSSLANTIRVAETNLTNDRFYNESVSRLEKAIAALQLQLASLINSRANAPQIIADAKAEQSRLRKRIKFLRHQADIKRILELQEQINAIGTIDPALLHEQLQEVQNGDDD